MLTLNQCLAYRPFNIVFLGKETDFIEKLNSHNDLKDIHDVEVVCFDSYKEALNYVLSENNKIIVFGLSSFFREKNVDIETQKQMINSFTIAGAEAFGDFEAAPDYMLHAGGCSS